MIMNKSFYQRAITLKVWIENDTNLAQTSYKTLNLVCMYIFHYFELITLINLEERCKKNCWNFVPCFISQGTWVLVI